MSEQNLVRRKCDYCGDTQELTNEKITPGEAARIQGWVVLVRVFLVKEQTYPVQKHACKDSCATNIISLGMLDLPQEIKDSLEEEKRVVQEFQKRLAYAKAHTFTPHSTQEDPSGQRCAVEGCGLTEMAHVPAAEA